MSELPECQHRRDFRDDIFFCNSNRLVKPKGWVNKEACLECHRAGVCNLPNKPVEEGVLNTQHGLEFTLSKAVKEEYGLGDLVEAAIISVGLNKVADWWESATGKGCGCQGRKEQLNKVKIARFKRFLTRV